MRIALWEQLAVITQTLGEYAAIRPTSGEPPISARSAFKKPEQKNQILMKYFFASLYLPTLINK